MHVWDVEADVVAAVDQVGCSHEDSDGGHVISGEAGLGYGPSFAGKKYDRDKKCFVHCASCDEDHQEVFNIHLGALIPVALRGVKSVSANLQKFEARKN